MYRPLREMYLKIHLHRNEKANKALNSLKIQFPFPSLEYDPRFQVLLVFFSTVLVIAWP